MAAYDSYARFYDATQGAGVAARYRDLLGRYHPHAQSLLEVACGTGAVLEQLASEYNVTAGLDISRSMLRIARNKLPGTRFHRQDMTTFQIDGSFDAAICPYDAINHLLRFGDWVKTFKAVKRHLNPQGVFVFDMNTEFRLDELIAQPPFAHEFDSGTLVINVVDAGRGVSDWQLKIFERESGSHFRLYRDSIKEVSFSADSVRKALNREFGNVRVFDADQDWSRQKKSSRRLYWVCWR